MKRFILTENPGRDGSVRLTGADYHYLVRVRRLKRGDTFSALAGTLPVVVTIHSVDGGVLAGSTVFEAAAAEAAPGSGDSVSGSPEKARAALPPIILFQALPKGTKMDLIARQAAEAGLSEVVPFAAEHSEVRENGTGREERWRRIVKEARQQSGSAIDTRIGPPLDPEALFARWETLRAGGALGIFLHQEPLAAAEFSSRALAQGTLHQYLYSCPRLVVLAVGPEGGFSAGEVRRFCDAGLKPLWLGETVLRTETAALYGAAAVRTLLLERTSWMLRQ